MFGESPDEKSDNIDCLEGNMQMKLLLMLAALWRVCVEKKNSDDTFRRLVNGPIFRPFFLGGQGIFKIYIPLLYGFNTGLRMQQQQLFFLYFIQTRMSSMQRC